MFWPCTRTSGILIVGQPGYPKPQVQLVMVTRLPGPMHTGSFWVTAPPGDDAGYVAVEGGQAPRRGEDGEAETGKLE